MTEGKMLSPDQVEELNMKIIVMDRAHVVHYLQNIPARFPVDFTHDFYATQPIGRLRHILFGLCLRNNFVPEDTVEHAVEHAA